MYQWIARASKSSLVRSLSASGILVLLMPLITNKMTMVKIIVMLLSELADLISLTTTLVCQIRRRTVENFFSMDHGLVANE